MVTTDQAILEQVLRAKVIEEARTWLATPFHHEGRVKGAGVDCAQILIAVYSAAGVVKEFTPEHYSYQFHLHRKADGSEPDEIYLRTILQFAHEIPGPPKPGDVAVFKFGRVFSHAVIVVDWPQGIHAYVRRGVEIVDTSQDQNFARRPVRFFSIWETK
jgi:cell wall-associated NlpC family hydrolase